MANIKGTSKILNYSDSYGKQLVISKGKVSGVNITVHHEEIEEKWSREEFRDMSFMISPESGKLYQIAQGLYDMVGNKLITSGDPIRDGRNFLYLEQEETEDRYYLTIGRDLSNELNGVSKTNVSLTAQYYGDLYDEVLAEEPDQEKAPQFTKIYS